MGINCDHKLKRVNLKPFHVDRKETDREIYKVDWIQKLGVIRKGLDLIDIGKAVTKGLTITLGLLINSKLPNGFSLSFYYIILPGANQNNAYRLSFAIL